MRRLMPEFLVEIAKASKPRQLGNGIMSIIVRWPYAHLRKQLFETFEGHEDVRVIVDRRLIDRRMQNLPVKMERRRGERRRQKETLCEVIIST